MGDYGPGARMSAGKGSPKDNKKTVSRLLHCLSGDRPKTILAFFCTIINTLATLAGSHILQPIINKYIAPVGGNRDDAAGPAGTLIVLALIYVFGVRADYSRSRTTLTVAQNTLQKTRGDLFTKTQRLPVRFYGTNNNGDLMSRFTDGVDTIGQMLSSALVQLFAGTLSTMGALALMPYTSIWLTLVTIALIPVMMEVGGAVVGRSQKYFFAQQSSLDAVSGYIEETITGQKVVEVFCHEEIMEEGFRLLNRGLRGNQIKAQFFGGIMGPVMGNLSQANYSLTVVMGGLLCVLRGFDVGGPTVFLNSSRQLSRPIDKIPIQISNVFSALVGVERVFSIMNEEPELIDDEDAVVLDPMIGHVVPDHVTFRYDEDEATLRDTNLYAKPGQKIAFIGSIGVGRATTANLLDRFCDVQSNEVTIDGMNIRHTERNNPHQNIAMVLQGTHLSTGIVQENIYHGRPDTTDGEVIQTTKTASAHSFITRLPHGYNTMLDDDGTNLSQGQRQLLNIARAAISKAPTLILNEATSSVDTKTEKHTEHDMNRLTVDRITFAITHRLSAAHNANAITVLEHDEIIKRGDHDELLTMKGRYYELCTGLKELD